MDLVISALFMIAFFGPLVFILSRPATRRGELTWEPPKLSHRGQDIRPTIKGLGFSATVNPGVWQKDLGRRLLELEAIRDPTTGLGVGLQTRTPGALGVGPNHPADHASIRIPFKEGFIVCSGASKTDALRLGRIELEELVQQLGAPFVQGEIPPFQLRSGWLRWTLPGKWTVEKHNALVKDATRLALALEDGLGESVAAELLEVVLTREGRLQAQALDTLLTDFPDTKEATTGRSFATNSPKDVLQLIGELDKAEPLPGLVLDLLAGGEIPVWLEARAKTQLQGLEVGSLMLLNTEETGKLSVSADAEGALSESTQQEEVIKEPPLEPIS